jgi:hypothetical protein
MKPLTPELYKFFKTIIEMRIVLPREQECLERVLEHIRLREAQLKKLKKEKSK